MYGHVQQLAEAEKQGVEAAGGSADIYQYDLTILVDRAIIFQTTGG